MPENVYSGINITASDMRNILERRDREQSGIRSWQQLFGGASLGYEAQAGALKSYYSDAMAQAYKSSLEQQNLIAGAGLSPGTTGKLMSLNRQELQKTYENYIRNYSENMQEAATAYGEEVGAISSGLEERSEKMASLFNKAYDYLKDQLYRARIGVDPESAVSMSEPFSGMQSGWIEQNKLDWLYTPETRGETEIDKRELLSWEEIMQQLSNPDGSLNQIGVQFFNKILNASAELEGYMTDDVRTKSFGTWLGETDKELYDWLVGADPFNYTFAGTNFGTAKTLFGRESTASKARANAEYTRQEDVEQWTENYSALIARDIPQFMTEIEKLNKDINRMEKTKKEHAKIDARPIGGGKTAFEQQIDYSLRKVEAEKTSLEQRTFEQFSTRYNTMMRDLEAALGTEIFNKFRSENKQLLDTYETYLKTKNAKGISSTVDQLMRKINEFFKANKKPPKKFAL